MDFLILEIYILVSGFVELGLPGDTTTKINKYFFYWSLDFILAETISGCTAAKAYSDCKCGEFLICHRDQYCHGLISGRPKSCEYHTEEGKLRIIRFHLKSNCVESIIDASQKVKKVQKIKVLVNLWKKALNEKCIFRKTILFLSLYESKIFKNARGSQKRITILVWWKNM